MSEQDQGVILLALSNAASCVATALQGVVEDCDGVYVDTPDRVWAAMVGVDERLEYVPDSVKAHFRVAAQKTSCSIWMVDGLLVVYKTDRYLDAEAAYESWLMRTDVRLRA